MTGEKIAPEPAELTERALAALARPGGVILVPTETVYGLVCDWADPTARERIYQLKGRDRSKPLAMFALDAEMAERAGVRLNPAARKLLAAFAPGPITVIARGEGAFATVGVRIPDHAWVLELLRRRGRPLASTSANASGMPNARTVQEAQNQLHGEVDLAADGGGLAADAQASTVVDATGDAIRVLRRGPIAEEALKKVLEAGCKTPETGLH